MTSIPAIQQFRSVLWPARTHITNFPSLIFLCGGDRAVATNIRSKVFAYVQANDPLLYEKIKLAENFIEWTDEEFFTNLIDLEDSLAHIVSFVPIILESPGAIAEFSGFMAHEQIRPKIKLYVEQKYANAQSYIALGPIKKLKERQTDKIFKYVPAMESALVEEIYNDLKKETRARHRQELFKQTTVSHQILLICEFVKMLSLARVTEIKFLLEAFYSEVSLRQIKMHMKLCEKVGLLKFVTFGSASDDVFYMSNYQNLNFAIFGFTATTARSQKDLLRWKSRIRQAIKEHDGYRRSMFLALEDAGGSV